MRIRSDARIIDSVMSNFCSGRFYFLMLLKYAVIEENGASLEGARIDFPDWRDPDEYYHFEGVKIVECNFGENFDVIDTVILVTRKEFLEICLYYIGEFKKAHPEEKDPLIPLAEEKLQKDLAAMQ